jgi:hypothetical protein
MATAEERTRAVFERERRHRNQLLDAARTRLAHHTPELRDWPPHKKRLEERLFPIFEAFHEALKRSSRPIKTRNFRKSRRAVTLFRTGTWPHWRGLMIRFQIIAMWFVQITLVLAVLGAVLYVLYQAFVLGLGAIFGPQ